MNPRQRRGAVLMILASIGAVAVFVAVLGYVSSVRAQVGNFRTVLRLTQDVEANASITKSMVEEHKVPLKWLDGSFISDTAALDGKVAVKALKKGSYLNSGMITDAPELAPGQREIAILVDAETGVAGKVRPNSRVDIYATFNSTDSTNQQPCAVRILANAQVLDVGKLRSERRSGANTGTSQNQIDLNKVVPVTFSLSPEDSLTLTHAESFAMKVRLALVAPGSAKVSQGERVCEVPSSVKTKEANSGGR